MAGEAAEPLGQVQVQSFAAVLGVGPGEPISLHWVIAVLLPAERAESVLWGSPDAAAARH